MEAIEFLDAIYKDIEGYINIVTMDPLDEEETIKSKFLAWPEKRDLAQRYLSIREDENTYCSVGVFSGKSRSGDDEGATCGVIWAEADTCPPSEFEVEPTLVVRTSRNRTHCWWVLDTPHPLAECSEVARSIYQRHRDKGCDSGWQASKLLRVPGSVNTKYGADYPVRVVENTGAVYTLDEIKAAYPVVRLEEAKKVGEAPPMCDDGQLRVIESKITSPSILSMYRDEVEDGRQSWSQTAKKFQMELFRATFSDNEVYQLMLRAHCNKYNPVYAGRKTKEGHTIPKRDNWELCTWREVQKFSAEARSLSINVDGADVIDIGDDASGLSRPSLTGAPTLLTDDEVAFVEGDTNPTFIKDYIGYASCYTDSYEGYHALLAFVVLSSLLGNVATIAGKGRSGPGLNLWALILGSSTASRKSSSVRPFIDLITLVDQQLDRPEYLNIMDDKKEDKVKFCYPGRTIIGSDYTVPALKRVLSCRHNRASIIHRDEVQGLFQAMHRKGSPAWADYPDSLNELYDGRVVSTHRVTSGEIKDARVVFSTVFTGIYRNSVEALVDEDFASGFCPRFVWAVDKSKEEDVTFSFDYFGDDEDSNCDAKGKKLGFGLSRLLISRINTLARKVTKSGSKHIVSIDVGLSQRELYIDPVMCHMDKEATSRANEWIKEAHHYYHDCADIHVVNAIIGRLAHNIEVAAALLSLVDRDDGLITKTHLLNVLYYASGWLSDAFQAAQDVAANDFLRTQKKVTSFIQKQAAKTTHGFVLCSSIRRAFPDLEPHVYKGLISTLVDQGVITGPTEREYKRNGRKKTGLFIKMVVDE